jgi:hypothetical protein
MAATWPGKDKDSPQPMPGDQWKITIRSRMPSPCNKKVMGSYTARKMELADAEARRALDRAVKAHVKGCKKCQANNIQA